jgi:serine/threonine kinase 38
LRQNFLHTEAEQMRQARRKMSITEFEPLSIIGRGAFGEVRVCRQISTGDIVAVKKMRKEDMLNKNQLMHVRTEKEIMTASDPWIVKLKYSFQDDLFLYLVMDFLPGGDLMNLLMKKEILTEDEARFYTAEMILAVDSVHKLNCIHRDLKPDNILIDKYGHIQLSDFGLAKIADKTFFPLTAKDNQTPKKLINTPADSISTASSKINTNKNTNINITKINLKNKNNLKKNLKKNRLIAYSTVGTPDYIAPEVFSQNGYGEEADWWSIGVMFFEMVVGFPPFFSENPSDTCKKIVKWKEYFLIPSDANLSSDAENFILRMVSPAEQRLGINGVEEIKKHPFFKGIDWDNIRKMKAPFIPELKNDYDTHYFDTFEEQEPFYPPASAKSNQRKDVNYAGYTFNRDFENIKDSFVQALEVLEAVEKTSAKKKNKEIITDSNSPDLKKKKINQIHHNTSQQKNNKENNIRQIINDKETNNNNKQTDNKEINNNIILNNQKISRNTNNDIILNNPRQNNNNNNNNNNPNGLIHSNKNNNSREKNSQNRNQSKNKEKIININSKSKEKNGKVIKMSNKSKEKDKVIKIKINNQSKSKSKDKKKINLSSRSKEKEINNKVNTISNKSKEKEKEPKLISINNKSKEKDNKIIILSVNNSAKGKENKKINNNNNTDNKGKETTSLENLKEKQPMLMQKNITSNNKIATKEIKKGNKSPNPGNGIIKKKIVLSNPKKKEQ